MDLKDKRVLVVGLGKSGVASALFLKSRGARVTVSDSKPEAELRKEILLLLEQGITVETGGHGDRTFRGQDLIVVSPGVPFDSPQLGKRMRVEHEDNALTMGAAAGRAMAGDTTPYSHLPFFYSDLFDLGYEAVGDTDPRLETFADWTTPFRIGVVYYLARQRVRGVVLWGIFGKVDEARALIADPAPVTAASLRGRIVAEG